MSLYIDDSSADDVRPKKDVDITMEIASLGELKRIRQELIKLGFRQSSEDHVMCRFRYQDTKVDVMATKEVGWAPANPWFASGFDKLIKFEIDEVTIRCLALPYYLATKFSAFYDRGIKDPRTSHDFEDIVYLLNYSTDWVSKVLASDDRVKAYLISCFADILGDAVKQEAIYGNLFYEDQDYRFKKIIEKIKQVSGV